MATLEQIIDEARSLSPAERRKLRQALDREIKPRERVLPTEADYRSRDRERTWIATHRDEYLGQWVAVEDDKLIAHGTNPRQVYLVAREAGIETPYLVRVVTREEPYTGGWL